MKLQKQGSKSRHRNMATTIIYPLMLIAISACQLQVSSTKSVPDDLAENPSAIHPEIWPEVITPPLDSVVETRVNAILKKLSLEQKVGQVIQGDSGSVTPEDVKKYRLGSVLSGGNSAPGPKPYAAANDWLIAADAYFEASIDPDGVEIAVPIIWGIDAVHGHANLTGAVVFPHNIGLGAANNPDLIERIAEVTARELTVSGHDWTFAPTLAVPRNDRWGRTYEGFSEDPGIVASYGDRIVYGLQGRIGSEGFMGEGRVIPSAKHFLADGGTADGIDQGDALISEVTLRDIHGAGYIPAVAAGAQTVMASFSAWQGVRMHGNKDLLTDVLKRRMNFNGFVVGDWNGHGLIPGCTNTDCPEALIAGLDMYMAPDSWRGLYDSTLEHVLSGEIPMDRLDDAVRRILRVKVASGIFDKPAPSARSMAGDQSILGSPEHRKVARQAVRESLVLLKNENNLLPLDTAQTILVVGPGADSISKAAGGWTLSWQGGGADNSEFPNGQSILGGIRDIVGRAGGTLIYAPDGHAGRDADVVIAVYGEDPYAEFRGDRTHLDFAPNDFDPARLAEFRAAGIPVISVFLSGRPLWVNPEINNSDAFVAAWLPGSEGGGVADLLFQTDPSYDFTGRLSYSWPKLATQVELNAGDAPYDPLFPLGYGLSFNDDGTLAQLGEDSGLDANSAGPLGVFLTNGKTPSPWTLNVNDAVVSNLPHQSQELSISAADHQAQEDALLLTWVSDDARFAIAAYGHDYARESNGAMELVFNVRLIDGHDRIDVGMGCDGDEASCGATIPVSLQTDGWHEQRITLSCFADLGVDMSAVDRPLILSGTAGQRIGLSEVRIEADTNARADCGDNG